MLNCEKYDTSAKILDEEQDRDIIDEWFEQTWKMTPEDFPEFMRHLSEDYHHDYRTVCHAMAAIGLAAMWAFNKSPDGGITGFQASCVMWDVIKHWSFPTNVTGLKIIDYDNMLFPQYESKFDKTINPSQWEKLQEEARKRLTDCSFADREVLDHWQSIVDGKVPFGYKINLEG